MKVWHTLGFTGLFCGLLVFAFPETSRVPSPTATGRDPGALAVPPGGVHQATFGAGCFWCSEAVFQRVEGVEKATPGYMGGTAEEAHYRQIITGRTGHAEVTHLLFDPEKVSYEELLDLFFRMHNPTTLNRQGADVGPHYRSVIFYHHEDQRQAALAMIAQINEEGRFANPIVTEVTASLPFYPAEEEHLNFFNRNPSHPYNQRVVAPKLRDLGKE